MRSIFAVLLLASSVGCSMRVGGIVSDQESLSPVAGAVISSDCVKGRNVVATTNGLGQYDLKMRKDDCNLTVGAPGYRTRTVTVRPGDTRFPIQNVELERAFDARPTAARPATAPPIVHAEPVHAEPVRAAPADY